MKIAIAQVQSVKGDVLANIAMHSYWIERAAAVHAEMIVFPELSLTNYEPALAKELSTTPDDLRFDAIQSLSDAHNIIIGAGMPTRDDAGIYITMILFTPQAPRRTYSKRYLHRDEEPFFSSGKNFPVLTVGDTRIALAICYELSVEAHATAAFAEHPHVYIASVAKSAKGAAEASATLQERARMQGIPVMMCNGVGPADDFVNAGGSSVWNKHGTLLKQLDNTHEGLIVLDIHTQEVSV